MGRLAMFQIGDEVGGPITLEDITVVGIVVLLTTVASMPFPCTVLQHGIVQVEIPGLCNQLLTLMDLCQIEVGTAPPRNRPLKMPDERVALEILVVRSRECLGSVVQLF